MNYLRHLSCNLQKPLLFGKPSLTLRRSTGWYKRPKYWLDRVGTREMVGYGMNGNPIYWDCAEFPFPALRYKEVTQEILALREKERGDWKLLTLEEKKEIYRASFCQTFAEFQAGTGKWMLIVGYGLIFVSLGMWLYIFIKLALDQKAPVTFTCQYERAQLRRQIHLQIDPIFGMCADWDYEKMDWKKKGWFTPTNPFKKKKRKHREMEPEEVPD